MSDVAVHLRYARIAPRKARAVVDVIRNQSTAGAVAQLAVMNKRAAKLVGKLLTAGLAAAKDKKLSLDKLTIRRAIVQEGPRLKRARSHFRGTIRPIDKQMSHITLVLTDEAGEKVKRQRVRTGPEVSHGQ